MDRLRGSWHSPLALSPRVLEESTGVCTEETPDNQHEEKAVNRELEQVVEAYDDVKGHPCTSKPASPIVSAHQKNTANNCEKLSYLDPDPIRRATVTEVNNNATDTHGQINAGDQNYRERNPLTAHLLANSLGSVLVHCNQNALRLASPGNSAPPKASSHQRLTGVDTARNRQPVLQAAKLMGGNRTFAG